LAKYLENTGFSKDEISNAYDSRALTLAYKAMQHDELKTSVQNKKVKKPAPRVIRKTGARLEKKAANKRVSEEKYNRLKKTGKAADADDLILHMMTNKN
jgi:hypothetical protein